MGHSVQPEKSHFIDHGVGFAWHQALHGPDVVVVAGVVVVVMKRPPQSCSVRPDAAWKPTMIREPFAFL